MHWCSHFEKEMTNIYLFMFAYVLYCRLLRPCKTPSHDRPLLNCTALINEAQNWTLDLQRSMLSRFFSFFSTDLRSRYLCISCVMSISRSLCSSKITTIYVYYLYRKLWPMNEWFLFRLLSQAHNKQSIFNDIFTLFSLFA